MRIDTVDIFYLSMPEVRSIGDGSQDMALVRVRGGGFTGWGECEASPLPTIAALVAPISHSACQGVLASVQGARLDSPDDIAALARTVGERGLDLLQTDHTWSGIEIALWDLLGKVRGEPVWSLLGQGPPEPRLPYASQLFGDDPDATFDKARQLVAAGFRAAKFGWGPYGLGSVAADAEQVRAAREGLGDEAALLVDAGTVWGEDVEAAAARLPALEAAGVTWLEEPFQSGALHAYADLARRTSIVLAAGEGAHNAHQARHLIDHGGIGYVQVDTGRIGGIGPAAAVARYAKAAGVSFVNHTFTSHLALVASLLPYADSAEDVLCEYPVEATPLATALTSERVTPGPDGLVRLPEGPGLGVTLDLEAVRPYLREVSITIDGTTLYQTPELSE